MKLPAVVEGGVDGGKKITMARRRFHEVNANNRVSKAKMPMDVVDINGVEAQPAPRESEEGGDAAGGLSAAERRRAHGGGDKL